MYTCRLCSYTTRFPSYLKRHSFVHNPVKSITCNLCGSKFKEQCAYRLHMKEKHGSGAHAQCSLSLSEAKLLGGVSRTRRDVTARGVRAKHAFASTCTLLKTYHYCYC